jgi:hypothetical protein
VVGMTMTAAHARYDHLPTYTDVIRTFHRIPQGSLTCPTNVPPNTAPQQPPPGASRVAAVIPTRHSLSLGQKTVALELQTGREGGLQGEDNVLPEGSFDSTADLLEASRGIYRGR